MKTCRECGAIHPRLKAHGLCRKCYKADWQRKNKSKQNGYVREWKKRNPEQDREYRRRGAGKRLAAQKRKRLEAKASRRGMTVEQYQTWLAEWQGEKKSIADARTQRAQRKRQLRSEGLKECNSCHSVKPISDYPTKKFETGRIINHECKQCGQARSRSNLPMGRKRYRENREAIIAQKGEYRLHRLRTDPRFNAVSRMRSRLRNAARRRKWNLKGAMRYFGYTPAELQARLHETMPDGYSWADFLSGYLHIDHIIPIKAFGNPMPGEPGFLECWGLSNLQLLPGPDNLRKSAKVLQGATV